MEVEVSGVTFNCEIEPSEEKTGTFTAIVRHLKPVEVVVERPENRRVTREVESTDDQGKTIIEKKQVVESVTVRETVLETKPVEIGRFTIYTNVPSRMQREMVKAWVQHSKKAQAIIEKSTDNGTEEN